MKPLYEYILPDGTRVEISEGTTWLDMVDSGKYFLWEVRRDFRSDPASDPDSKSGKILSGFPSLESAIDGGRTLVKKKLLKLKKQAEKDLLVIQEAIKGVDKRSALPFAPKG